MSTNESNTLTKKSVRVECLFLLCYAEESVKKMIHSILYLFVNTP